MHREKAHGPPPETSPAGQPGPAWDAAIERTTPKVHMAIRDYLLARGLSSYRADEVAAAFCSTLRVMANAITNITYPPQKATACDDPNCPECHPKGDG